MKFKKLTSSLLAAGMAASLLTGCGGFSGDNSSDQDVSNHGESEQKTSNGTNEQNSDQGSSLDASAAVINMDEDPYTVAIQVVIMPGSESSEEELTAREGAINAITAPAINCNVDIQEVTISDISTTTSLAIAGGEKADIIHVATVQKVSTMVGSDMLYDMNTDDLLQTRGQNLVELFGDALKAGAVDGQQLAVPAIVYPQTRYGIYYNKALADSYGITIPETITIDDLEEILYKVHEADPEIKPFYVGTGVNNYLQWLVGYEGFGSECAYGVVLDSSKDTTIENLYATDLFKDFCLRMYHWKQDGILSGDSTDNTAAQVYFSSGQLFCVVANIDYASQVNYGSSYSDMEVGYAYTTDPVVTNASVTEYMWGIASNSERPDKAMDFLNFMYGENGGEVGNILKYGLEGQDYEFKEGSDKVIVQNGNYSPMFYKGGNDAYMLIASPGEDDYLDKIQEERNAANVSPISYYTFNDSAFQTEASVINTAITEYLPRLQNGMAESEEQVIELIDELVTKLQTSAIDDVIAANQEQLNAFLDKQ